MMMKRVSCSLISRRRKGKKKKDKKREKENIAYIL